MAMVFHRPTLEELCRVLSFNPKILTRPAEDNVNIDAISTVLSIHRIFSSFFKTHTYLAFTDSNHLVPYEDFSLVPKGDN